MALTDFAKLELLEIQAYSDAERSVYIDSFEAMFNPESIQQYFYAVFNSYQGINTTAKPAQYMYNPPQTLSLNLVIDGSRLAGITTRPSLLRSVNVMEKVEAFQALTYQMNGDIHAPNYLTLIWGEFDYDCLLQNFSVNYTSFNNSGKPLRAEIQASFVLELSEKKRKRIEAKKSPDLTHKRIVKSGDELPLMLKEIYGDASLYLEVARFNQLDDFRNLVPGQEIIFPPIEKS